MNSEINILTASRLLHLKVIFSYKCLSGHSSEFTLRESIIFEPYNYRIMRFSNVINTAIAAEHKEAIEVRNPQVTGANYDPV